MSISSTIKAAPQTSVRKFSWLPLHVIWGVLWIGLGLFSSLLDDWLDLDKTLTVWISMFGGWCLLLIGSLITLVRSKQHGWARGRCLVFDLATIALVALIVSFDVPEKVEWQVKRRGFENVARLVHSGQWKIDGKAEAENRGSIGLKDGFAWLSVAQSGVHRVWVQKRGHAVAVAFISSRGFLGGDTGYVFCSDGVPPRADDFGWRLQVLQTKNAHWYRCYDSSSWDD